MCRWVLLWVSLASLVVAIPEEHQYCAVRYRRLCQGKGRHVACQFPDSGPGPSCERYTQIKFTNDLKHFITHYLNRRRQRIAAGNERVRGGVHLPKPQIMMLVEWDRELALLAQRLADQCHFVHDDCRATVRYPYAGQTVGEVRWRRSSESDELSAQRAIRRVLDAWWGERRRVQPKQLTAPFRLTAKGTVWGHFSQLAVWNLQAVGCGAVRHGLHHPRLLLVCDFSHTNMLGQRTLVTGTLAPCPIHTARRPRTAYPLLCAPVRHPVPSEPEEIEMEDNYEDEEEDDTEGATVEVGDVPTPSLWQKKKDKRPGKPKPKTKVKTTNRDFPEETRKDTKMYRASTTTTKESLILNLDRELDQKTRNKVNNKVNVKYKEAQKSFDSNQFESIVNSDWRNRKKPNYGQWRQSLENPETAEEPAPPTPSRNVEMTETVESTVVDVYRPTIGEEVTELSRPLKPKDTGRLWYRPTVREESVTEHTEHTGMELYRPTVREDGTDTETAFRARWKQTRVRPQRPGANALMSYPTSSRNTNAKKEFIMEHTGGGELYRPTAREDATESETIYRSRWKQPRVRPQRPGANALMSYSITPRNTDAKKDFIASLNLDKEDTDQLFRDTGFNMQWRKQTT